MMKRISALLALLLLCAAVLTGCGKSSGSALAAKVADEEITVEMLQNMFANNTAAASYYGYDLTTASGVSAFRELLLDSMISQRAQYHEAVQAGVTLTAEEENTAKEAAQKDYEDMYQQYMNYATQNGAADAKAQANKYMADYLSSIGSSVSKLKKSFLTDERRSLIIEKYENQLLTAYANENLSPERILELYQAELADQTEAFASTPSMYFSYEAYASYGYTCAPLTIPEGFFYVKHVLVEDLAEANLVKEKAAAGEDFDALIAQYNTDPGMTSNADGYMVGEGANFVEPFLNAALALEKEGDVSDVVQSDHGYHVIRRYGDVPAGPLPWEDVKDSFTSYITDKEQTSYYNGLVEQWSSADYVERYPDAYAKVGMDGVTAEEPASTEAPSDEPAPSEAPAAEETPAAEPTAEEAPAEQPAAEEAPATEPAAEEAPAEQPAAEETPAA